MTDGKLELDVRCNRAHLPVEAPGTSFVYVSIRATKEAENEVRYNPRSVHLIHCIDVSGSMAGEKLDTAKEVALRRARKDLSPDDLVSLVTFTDNANVVIPMRRVGEISGELENRIKALKIGSLTNIYEGIEKAADIARGSPPGYVRRVLLITDGCATTGVTDSTSIIELARRVAKAQSLVVDVIGIGAEYDHDLCQETASAANGSLMHAATPKDIEGLSKTALDRYKGTVVDQLQPLYVRLLGSGGGNVSVEGIIQVSPEVKSIVPDKRGDTYSCQLGPLSVGSPYALAIRLTTSGYPTGTSSVASIEIGDLQRQVEIDFTNNLAYLQAESNGVPRVAYMIGSRIAEIADALASGDKRKESDGLKQLDSILAVPGVLDIVRNDLVLSALVARYHQSKTVVDERTKLDTMSRVFI